jgi:hypothetical protein
MAFPSPIKFRYRFSDSLSFHLSSPTFPEIIGKYSFWKFSFLILAPAVASGDARPLQRQTAPRCFARSVRRWSSFVARWIRQRSQFQA